MGTHPSGPSTIGEGEYAGTQLLAYVRDHPEVLGNAAGEFGADLPFLLKVLSVRTALSIQSHPDKQLAEKLHADRPNVYKDGNHKPEMALALSDFEALCGFVAHEELVEALTTVPELHQCCGAAAADAYVNSGAEDRQDALKTVFSALMLADPGLVRTCIEAMVARLQGAVSERQLSPKEQLVLRLNEQYPNDVGVLSAWFLNYVTMKTGEAIALAANEPHAYVSGEIVECMATSDNVIRAGLTPKLRDTDALCSSLTYVQGLPEVYRGVRDGRHLALYRPAFKEFEMYRFDPVAGTQVDLPAARGPMILLVQHGSGTLAGGSGSRRIKRGDVLFVAAGTPLAVTATEDMLAWFAAPNSMGLMP